MAAGARANDRYHPRPAGATGAAQERHDFTSRDEGRMNLNWTQISDTITTQLTAFGLKAAGALAVWIIGRYLISLAVRLISAALTRQDVDPTILRYVGNIVTVTLNIILVIAILGYFGVETTSFAALIAAAGIAIGAAWAGLLANFAAGAFLIILRPFKVGDYVKAGGVEGTVKEIGLFASTILTPDNVSTFVGNNKIFGDTIFNYSASAYRRVDRLAQLAHSVDPQDAIARLKTALAGIANVEKTPAPDVEIVDFNERGPVLAVRPYTHTDHYWQVYFDTNRAITETFGAAGYAVPESHVSMRQRAA
jgi:small conductance mechanosensitive channel